MGERRRDRFGAGTVFVPLDTVTEPGLVLVAVGRLAGADLGRAFLCRREVDRGGQRVTLALREE